MTKKEELWVPDPEDVRIWEEYLTRQRPPPGPYKRKRLKRMRGTPWNQKKHDRNRPSPSKRGYRSIMVYRETYEMLAEMRKFYRVGFMQILRDIVEAGYKKTYKQSELLARIEARKESGDEVKYRP